MARKKLRLLKHVPRSSECAKDALPNSSRFSPELTLPKQKSGFVSRPTNACTGIAATLGYTRVHGRDWGRLTKKSLDSVHLLGERPEWTGQSLRNPKFRMTCNGALDSSGNGAF